MTEEREPANPPAEESDGDTSPEGDDPGEFPEDPKTDDVGEE